MAVATEMLPVRLSFKLWHPFPDAAAFGIPENARVDCNSSKCKLSSAHPASCPTCPTSCVKWLAFVHFTLRAMSQALTISPFPPVNQTVRSPTLMQAAVRTAHGAHPDNRSL